MIITAVVRDAVYREPPYVRPWKRGEPWITRVPEAGIATLPGAQHSLVGQFPGLHIGYQVQVSADGGFQAGRVGDSVEDVRFVVGAGIQIADEVLPTTFVERVAHPQQHAVLVGKRILR